MDMDDDGALCGGRRARHGPRGWSIGRRLVCIAALLLGTLGVTAVHASTGAEDGGTTDNTVDAALEADGGTTLDALAAHAAVAALAAPERGSLSGNPLHGMPLTVSGLLRPGGFERPHWRSFEHVRPLPEPTAGARDASFVVVIDPGHGGSDPGAKAPNGLLEKHLTLDIARRARLFLSEIDDIEVVLTRERDEGLSRRSRVDAVRASEADLFVSLHFNHLPQSEVTLVESYYAGPGNVAASRDRAAAHAENIDPHLHVAIPAAPDMTFTLGSKRFATLVQRRVFDEVSRGNPDTADAGVKRRTLFVLTRSLTSGALVELTCLSNAAEAERLTDAGYRDRLAAALADAIRDYRTLLEERPLEGADA